MMIKNTKSIFFIRHDKVVFPEHHDCAGQEIKKLILGQLDYPIIDVIHHQRYQKLADEIRGDEDSVVFVGSDLLRVRQTFDRLVSFLNHPALSGIDLMTDRGWREQDFGAWQGLTHEEVAVRDKIACDEFWRDYIFHAPPNGESFFDLYQRVAMMMAAVMKNHGDKKIMVIAHGGVLRSAFAYFHYQAGGGENRDDLCSALELSMAQELPPLSCIRVRGGYEKLAKPVIEIL